MKKVSIGLNVLLLIIIAVYGIYSNQKVIKAEVQVELCMERVKQEEMNALEAAAMARRAEAEAVAQMKMAMENCK